MARALNIIQITGASADLLGTRDIDGLRIGDHGQKVLGPDQFRVSADASDDAIATLKQRGFAVDVIFSGDDMDAHFAALDAESGGGDPGAVV